MQHLSLLFHFQLVAGLADNGSLSLHVNGNGVIPGGSHPADVLRSDSLTLLGDEVHLVGQANADQGAARALGAVHQGLGNLPRRRHAANPRQQPQCAVDQPIIEWDRHPLTGLDEIKRSVGARVSVGAEQQSLDANLNPFRLPGAPRNIRCFAVLVVHRGDHASLAFNQVDAGDYAQGIVGKHHGTGMNGLAGIAVFVR